MSIISQLVWGTAILGLCAVIHVAMIASSISMIRRLAKFLDTCFPRLEFAVLTFSGFALVVAAHTAQIWLWAGALLFTEVLETFEVALYFSLVTYTTLGYGDIILPVEARIFGAFASVTGLLTFGVSAAYLVALITRIMPRAVPDHRV